MAINRKLLYNIITVLLVAAAIVAACLSMPAAAFAEQNSSVALSHVKTEGDGVAYYCFDDPRSVYADDGGIAVAGSGGIYGININAESGQKDITLNKVPADKVRRAPAGYTVLLADGKIATLSEDNGTDDVDIAGVTGDILDFDVCADKLFAVTTSQIICAPLSDGGIDGQNATVAELYSDKHTKITAGKIAVADGVPYISVKAVFGNKWDICVVRSDITNGSPAELTTVLNSDNSVLSLTAYAADAIYVLTRSEIVAYKPTMGGLNRQYAASGENTIDIYAYDGNVYALDTVNALHVLSGDLSTDNIIAASASDAQGFFNMPFGVSAKKSTLYIADTGNDRVAMYDKDGIKYLDREFRNPVSVTADNAGTVYVAYDDNKVGIFHGNAFSLSDEITVTSSTLGRIRKIVVDSSKTLFILADNGLFTVGNDLIPRSIGEVAYIDIALSVSRGDLYALSNDSVVMLDRSTGEAKSTRSISGGGISLAVDLNNAAFVLYRDKIAAVPASGTATEYALELDGDSYELGSRGGQIVLCFMENGLSDNPDEHNYAIVLDTFKNRVLKASGNSIGARFVDYSYVSPDIAGDRAPAQAQNGIVRKIRFDTPLFAYPIETASDYTLTGGKQVIVPDYAAVAPSYKPEETPDFALVLIDDSENNRLIQGYVYKDALTEPIEYSPPPSEICTVTGALGTAVYKWPSRNSVAVQGYSEVENMTKFDMLDFVDPFRDGYGYFWYRIALENGAEGYVPAINISTIDYQQANILPDYNAEIVEYGGNDTAKTYSVDEHGNYSVISDFTLKAGTKVEVVGAFDSSVRYTQIKFLDEKSHKTVTCYVESVHIKYTGVNIVLIAAIIVLAITMILAVIIISRVYYSKKKRLDNDGDNNVSDTD